MISKLVVEARSRKGLIILGALVASLLLAGCIALAFSTPESFRIPTRNKSDLLSMAMRAYSEQRFADAAAILRTLGGEGSGDSEAQVLCGYALLELGQLTAARSAFESAGKDTSNVDALVGLGQVYERQGGDQLDLAISCFTRASEARKDDGRILRLLGLAQEKRGDVVGALGSFRRSLKILPGQEDLIPLIRELSAQASRSPRMSARQSEAEDFDPFQYSSSPVHGHQHRLGAPGEPGAARDPFSRERRGQFR
jgi:cytochrome c-type biogenesis protein CcmH/NrfG